MTKAIFLDRDGTINVEKHYLYKIEDFEFLPGVIQGLKKLQNLGFLLIIITNQSGIARGYYTEDDYNKLTEYMLSILESNGVHVSKVYYCPHLEDAIVPKYRKVCNCRKPKLGMYYKAIEELDIDLSKSWAIGDKERDCEICNVSECKGILLSSQENNDNNTLYNAKNFLEAVALIESFC